MPKSKLSKIGVWEDGIFIGAVIYGLGATPELCKPYGLKSNQVSELCRVALKKHKSKVSRIIAISLRMVSKANPGLKLIVSFADSEKGHHGGIYQAGNWIYTGQSYGRYIITNGKKEHPRTLGLRYGKGGQSLPWLKKNVDPSAKVVKAGAKYRYLMPLDDSTRDKVVLLSKQMRPKKHVDPDQGNSGRSITDLDAPNNA